MNQGDSPERRTAGIVKIAACSFYFTFERGQTHDYRTLLIYTLDKETDYFGHKNSSSAFIQQDMTQDARSYKWCRFVPDLSTFETSLGHDSIEYDSDALDVRGKEHKARCRLDIYYSATTSPRLQALSLKVLRN
jgi:hypothetical protein